MSFWRSGDWLVLLLSCLRLVSSQTAYFVQRCKSCDACSSLVLSVECESINDTLSIEIMTPGCTVDYTACVKHVVTPEFRDAAEMCRCTYARFEEPALSSSEGPLSCAAVETVLSSSGHTCKDLGEVETSCLTYNLLTCFAGGSTGAPLCVCQTQDEAEDEEKEQIAEERKCNVLIGEGTIERRPWHERTPDPPVAEPTDRGSRGSDNVIDELNHPSVPAPTLPNLDPSFGDGTGEGSDTGTEGGTDADWFGLLGVPPLALGGWALCRRRRNRDGGQPAAGLNNV